MEEADSDEFPEWMNIENSSDIYIIQEEEMMKLRLLSVKYDKDQLKRCGIKTNQYLFKVTFDVLPTTICRIYDNLQTSTAEDTDTNPSQPMHLKGSKINLQWFLRTIYYLRKYLTEDNIDRVLELNKGLAQKKIWGIIEKIQCLEFKKITQPDDLGDDNIWIMTLCI